jgi:hypothetical protein
MDGAMRKQTEQKRARLNLSLNLSAPHQREAWNILRAIPAGQRTDAVCRMICKGHKQEDLLDSIRAVIREELHRVEFVSVKEKNEQPQAGDVDDNVLGFLLGLQREGDDEPSDSLF